MTDKSNIANPYKVDKQALLLTMSLESVMLVTFRPETANTNIKYISPGEGPPVLSSSNISEVICDRLSEESVFGGAVGYLSGCYKRIISKESGTDENTRNELAACRKQIVTFLASSLVEPDLFGANTINSLNDFHKLLLSDVGGAVPQLLKELADELSTQAAIEKVRMNLTSNIF